MAIKASAAITLSCVVDVRSTTRYYLLRSSTQAAPAKPTANPPTGGWDDTEPSYTSGSTNSLYFTDLTVFSDGTWAYSSVSLSSAYEAAKAAYNLARAAENEAAQALSSTECIVGTQTAATNAWTGRASFASLTDGQVILYWLPYAGTSTAATLNLTLSGGGTTGAKNVYINATTRCTTHIAAGNMVQMVYRVGVNIGETSYTGWWICRALNDNTYDRIRFNNVIKAKTAISASRVIVGDSGGYFHLAAGSVFDVDKPILWAASAIAAAATGTNNYLSFPGCTLRNNAGSSWTAAQYETLYLAGTLVGNIFTVAGGDWLTTSPTNEALTYISLGYMYSTFQMYLYPEHPMYRLVDGVLTAVSQIAYEAQVAADEAKQAVDDLDDALTQQEIFNRLTDNGAAQGLVLANGQLYVNATYINTGTLDAKRIAANSIAVEKLTGSVSGGLNNSWTLNLTDGTFTIGSISAASVTTGTMSAARISGGTLTLGGASNGNGQMVVKDANNATIVTANNAGLSIAKGTITSYSSNNKARASITSGQLALQSYRTGGSGSDDWQDDFAISVNTSGVIGVSASQAMNLSSKNGDIKIYNDLAPNAAGCHLYMGYNGSLEMKGGSAGATYIKLASNSIQITGGSGNSITFGNGDDLASFPGPVQIAGTLSAKYDSTIFNTGGEVRLQFARDKIHTANQLGTIVMTTGTSNNKRRAGQFRFRHQSYDSSTGDILGYYDQYQLPAAAADKTANNTYNILTSKSAVTVGQGGTGATTAAAALKNLGFATKTVTGTPTSNANISLGLNATKYYVVACYATSSAHTVSPIPYVSDDNWYAHCARVGSSYSVLTTSVTLNVLYVILPA